jgi:hypothetical protein
LSIGIIPTQEIYTYIWETCVQNEVLIEFPKDLRAGVPNLVAQVVLLMSGANNIPFISGLLDMERQQAHELESQLKSKICRVFPGYTMDKLDDLDFPNLVSVFAKAEAEMLESKLIEKPFELIDKNKPQKKDKFTAQEAAKDAERLRRL